VQERPRPAGRVEPPVAFLSDPEAEIFIGRELRVFVLLPEFHDMRCAPVTLGEPVARLVKRASSRTRILGCTPLMRRMTQIFRGDSGRGRRLGALPEFHPPTEREHLSCSCSFWPVYRMRPTCERRRCRADQTRQRSRWLLQRQGGVAREERLRADSSRKMGGSPKRVSHEGSRTGIVTDTARAGRVSGR